MRKRTEAARARALLLTAREARLPIYESARTAEARLPTNDGSDYSAWPGVLSEETKALVIPFLNVTFLSIPADGSESCSLPQRLPGSPGL